MSESRLYRVIVLGGASLVGSATLAVICGNCGGGGDETSDSGCFSTFRVDSPCGITNITTTCTGGPAQCGPSGSETECSIGPVTTNCSVTVELGDGTTHVLRVTVRSGCVDQSGFVFCGQPDAAADAESDATTDASSD